jgi:hypothetical protein
MTMDLLLFTEMFFFLYHYQDNFYRTWLYIWATRRVSYKKHKLITLRDHLSYPPFFLAGSVLFIFVVVLFCHIMCLYVLSSLLWCPLRFHIKTMFGSSLPPVVCRSVHVNLIYVICGCLRIVVSNAYCVLYLFCFSSCCVPYVASFSGFSIFDCLFGIF